LTAADVPPFRQPGSCRPNTTNGACGLKVSLLPTQTFALRGGTAGNFEPMTGRRLPTLWLRERIMFTLALETRT
jgi:hypothetical protein